MAAFALLHASASCLIPIGEVESDGESGGGGGNSGGGAGDGGIGTGGSAATDGGTTTSGGSGGSGTGGAGTGGGAGGPLHACKVPSAGVGDPALPAEFFDLAFPAATGTTHTVVAGADLQQVLDQVQPGDEVVIAAGATFTGNFLLKSFSGDAWVTIRSAALSALPEGKRVAPADAIQMPTLRSPNAEPALATQSGAHHYRIAGIRFTASDGVFVNNIVTTGTSAATQLADQPHHLVFDRCLFQGDAKAGAQRGLKLNAAHAAVLDSHFSSFKHATLDSNAISPWNGPGPFLIHNNYLEGSFKTLRIGGEDPSISQLVPSDVRICQNHITKPLTWKADDPSYAGADYRNAYLLSIESGRRVLVSGNVLEHAWLDGFDPHAVFLSPKNQAGAHTWAVVEDVTIAFNLVRKAGSGIWIDESAGTNPDAGVRRIRVQQNLFYSIDDGAFTGSGRFLSLLGVIGDLRVTQNTVFTPSAVANISNTVSGFVFVDNVAGQSQYGLFGAGTTEGKPTLDQHAPGYQVTHNVLVSRPASAYPQPNYFPATNADVGFVDVAGADFRLAATSSYQDKSSTGGPVGADVTAVLQTTGGVAQ